MKVVDFRSDTVTKPSPEMWEMVKLMNNSKLGDDVEQEDPTVNALEKKAAKLVGKEASLYVTSGTQGNLISLLSQTKPGDQIMVERLSHIFGNEVGSAARIGGLMVYAYPSNNGVPDLDNLEEMIGDPENVHKPATTLLCAENTHNFHGGVIIKPNDLQKMKFFADKKNMKLHIDGARIFNAAVALNIPVTELTQYGDSIMFCLSKGLSCPVGSIVAGSTEFIKRARKFRKMLGGGMRQAGIIACFGVVALESNWINRLKEDHKNAKQLAEGMMGYNLPIQVQSPETNIFFVSFPKEAPMEEIMADLYQEGVKVFNFDHKIRFVTHYGITEEDIQYSIEIIEKVLKKFF